MKHKLFLRALPFLMVTTLILGGCNLPGTGGNNSAEIQAQTMAAQTLSVVMGQFLTQTAQAVPVVIVITATPQPTATATATSTAVPPTPTATATNTKTPTKTPLPIPCNLATFVDDVTVENGTTFYAGTAFVKTWRIRNIGSCTWGSGYQLFFYRGDSMDGPAYVNLPKTVVPGESVDVSVSLVAPNDPDKYYGEWMLRSGDGREFGVGGDGRTPVNVEIKVKAIPESHDPNITYDFVENYCDADWRTNAGSIDCPSSSINYKNGTISRTYAPILENGEADDEGTLITIPAKGGDGMIQGEFPKYLVHAGDHLRGTLLCSYKKSDCSVKFEILAREKGTSTITSLGSWDKNYGDDMIKVDIDLSAMDGTEEIFYLKVYSLGDPTDDMAQWMAIRITHP